LSVNPEIVHIRAIGDDPQGIADWLRVPKLVHADDPLHVIQPDKQERHRISRAHNPYLAIAEAAFFVCYRDGVPVGRISAQYDPRLKADDGEVIGQFGFADFIQDQRVADALVAQARSWLRERGARQMRGPFNLSINQECGCLVEGFETASAIMMPRSRPWTGPMLERCGLSKAMDLLAYRVVPQELPDRLLEIASRAEAGGAINVRPVDTKNLATEFELLGRIFNDGWQANWGFLPFTKAELDFFVRELKPIIRPDYGFFVEIEGRPVGVMMALPNINETIAPFRGKFGLINTIKLGWSVYREKTKTARVLILGIGREYQGGGLGAALVVRMLDKLIARMKRYNLAWVEFSWVLEENGPAVAVLEASGAKAVKRYRIYHASQ